METYDLAIVGLGPAGAALARQLAGKMRIIAFDKKQQTGTEGFTKPCGGLLAPDAQRAFIRADIPLPVQVIANPQIFSVRTMDLQSGLTRIYQRCYVNLDRHAFDLWMKSLIPDNVSVYHDSLCKKIWFDGDLWHLVFVSDGREQEITSRYLVGADGANSLVRRHLYPDHHIRKYVSIQEWFVDKHPVPFYSCLFDNTVTDCYSWSISKDGYFIFGGAFPMKTSNENYEALKQKMADQGFQFGEAVKKEKCTVLYPSRWGDFVCGKDNAFLIGEAAGFISPSSLEGISYALDSAEIVSRVLAKGQGSLNRQYRQATLKLRLKLLSKIVKSRLLTTPVLRGLLMKSGIQHIPLNR
ncbi:MULTISPECIES: FAD-binding protein [Enterobacterales]|uniref:FAD-binding protein n=1 Tax=Enterobacterales TaxID=91347 RepID=UPI002EDBA9C5